MKILILAAMDKELNLLKSLLTDSFANNTAGISTFEGVVGNHSVIVAKCGIGKVNAAINAYKLIAAFHPDLVINSGVAGGAGLPIGTVLIADRVAYDDVWCGPGTNYGQADGFPEFFLPANNLIELSRVVLSSPDISYGLICSGDKFISSAEEIAFIRSKFPEVKAVDMESAAIAQVCAMTATPFNILRVVSDTPGEGENISQYKNFWTEAPQKTFSAVKTLIEKI